jgi:hypothetical protein
VAGTLRCVGAVEPSMEVCDGDDDDCDGEIDDDAPCPPGRACIDAQCRRRCDPDMEFTCPVGMLCEEVDLEGDDAGTYCLPSACALCTSIERCDGERCVSLCEGVSCGPGETCVQGDCRDCHFVGCPGAGQVCQASECVDDPCADVECAADEACRAGRCVAVCDDASCPEGQRCDAGGRCVADACAGRSCPAGQACVGGECEDDPCVELQCVGGDVCVASMGCIDDPCPLVRCPDGRTCAVDEAGEPRCVATAGDGGGAGGDEAAFDDDGESYVTAAGGGLITCSAGLAGATPRGRAVPPLLLALALGAGVCLRRRRL